MKQKKQFSLGKKLAAMILLMGTVLCATALFVSYRTYQARSTAFYERLGSSVVTTLAMRLDPDELDRYYESSEMDDAYYETQELIRDLVESHGVEYLYVVRPHGVGVTFLFDSDMSAGEQGEYYDGGYCALGTYVDLVGDFAANLDNLLAGRPVEPITQRDESYGWQMTVMTPVLHEDGTMAAYVMADISMNEVVQQQRAFLLYTGGLLAALTAIFVVAYLLWIRKIFVRPVQQLTHAARDYADTQDKQLFAEVDIRSSDELRTLSDTFQMMLGELDANAVEQTRVALREQRMESELQLANELNASMMPKALPDREGGYPFDVCGLTHHGRELGGSFYDYFLLDKNRLCVVAAEVPGSGIPQALYTVMAQATLKSQMRSALSLTEAMTAVNRQLFEMGSRLYLNAVVGVLDGATGRFSCINAGQSVPLLLRSGDRYEWMNVPQCVPLGQSENVVYRTAETEMRQGDRIFFHTAAMDRIPDTAGHTFGEDKLRLTLNIVKQRQVPLSRRLQAVSDAAGAYAVQLDDVGSYALLALEYRRRDRAQAHCLLEADDGAGTALTAFLREQLEKNGIDNKQTAAFCVLAEELLTLCRRQGGREQRFMAECIVPPAEETVLLRLRGNLGGHDPLDGADGEAAWAADFICKNSDRVLFEHTDTEDVVTVYKCLSRAQTAKGGESL